MKKKFYIVGVASLFCLSMLLLLLFKSGPSNLELVKINSHPSNSYGILMDDLTFENVINKFSSHIVLGTINNTVSLAENKDLFSVDVEQVVHGSLESDTIEIYIIDENILEVGQSYIFFLTEMSSTLYPRDFYVQFSEFVLKVSGDKVLRLTDANTKEYIEPFTDEKFNNINVLLNYISQNKKDIKTNSKKALQKSSSLNELVSISDHIIEIRAIEVIPEQNNLSSVQYEIINSFKGDNFDNFNYLLLPNAIMEGETYIIFLQNRGDGLTLSTREGSIINHQSKEYNEILDVINNN